MSRRSKKDRTPRPGKATRAQGVARSGNPARRGWDPMTRRALNPDHPVFKAVAAGRRPYPYRNEADITGVEAWGNRLYDATVVRFADGGVHISFKRRDRAAVRDWRHFQAIKNEVAGFGREAIEVFPSEDNLLDASNQYHLWVLPDGLVAAYGMEVGLGQASRGAHGAARQRDWEPGIPTGLGGAAEGDG